MRTNLLFFLVLSDDDSFSESSKRWSWSEGVYLVGWMRYQIFLPLFLLQLINLFWYYLMIKILVRLDIFFHTYLSLTSILGPYARLMLMTIDRMTKAKATMINRTKPKIWILTSYVKAMDISTCIRFLHCSAFSVLKV